MSGAEFVAVGMLEPKTLREGDEVSIRFEGDDAEYRLTVRKPGGEGALPEAIFARGVRVDNYMTQWTPAENQPYRIVTSLPDTVDQEPGKEASADTQGIVPPLTLALGNYLVLQSDVEGYPSRVTSGSTISALALRSVVSDTPVQAS